MATCVQKHLRNNLTRNFPVSPASTHPLILIVPTPSHARRQPRDRPQHRSPSQLRIASGIICELATRFTLHLEIRGPDAPSQWYSPPLSARLDVAQ
ncbi:hypothetical protein PHSY_007463 [Pseudozyma hubeiensis SY62]|uniref:Uncharacterized protein n=1 Tax=Pseudozyma hubeiensis (strain SY62) TaxID=1305764 RepID=R9PP44_PSEHS|nr:hypothetical protein PHSY_007463 [Pseudozyma hubeiensis SY62]GAC99860.1 hypothetical protein PHSY_007463 [Pseudozyma hubeiensis SY62]